MSLPRIAYISFDVVPAPKGAAIHIETFAKALGAAFGSVHLITVSPTESVEITPDRWPNIKHIALPALGKSLIDRVLYFRHQLWHHLHNSFWDVIQIRSIYEGFPIALQKPQICRHLIFEVNGLPSSELKYRYPNVVHDRELMQKLLAQEQICLEAADRIMTPSQVTQDYLIQRKIPAARVQVIPNGVDLTTFTYQPPRLVADLQPFQLLYFGTLAAWQGVDLAVEALALYCREFDAELTIVGPVRADQMTLLMKLATKLEVNDRIHILGALSQTALVHQIHQADAIAAPLKPNDRNLVQGCCPLKVLEGMASGTPVITSDLPVVQNLAENGRHVLAVRPGSAKAIKDAMLQLQADPSLRQQLSRAARSQVEQHYTWTQANQALLRLYQQLGVSPHYSLPNSCTIKD